MNSKRITAGVIFNAGHVSLAKEEIIQAVRYMFKAKNALIIENVKKDISRYNKRKDKARQIFVRFLRKKTSPSISFTN